MNESIFNKILLAFDSFSKELTDSYSEELVALSRLASSIISDSSLLLLATSITSIELPLGDYTID